MQRQLTLWPTAWHPATCNSHRSGPRNGPFWILKQAISKRHTACLTARCGIQGRARMLMLNLVAYLQPQSYCAHSLFLFPRAFAHCCLECTPKGPYRATDATVPHFLMPSQRPPLHAPLADTWRTMARTTAMAPPPPHSLLCLRRLDAVG